MLSSTVQAQGAARGLQVPQATRAPRFAHSGAVDVLAAGAILHVGAYAALRLRGLGFGVPGFGVSVLRGLGFSAPGFRF